MANEKKAKDAAMAATMKKYPGRYPDCFTRRTNPQTAEAGRAPVRAAAMDSGRKMLGYIGGMAVLRGNLMGNASTVGMDALLD